MPTGISAGRARATAIPTHRKVGETIRIERYVEDAIEGAEHFKARYGKRKLILMGHSWGTNRELDRPGRCAIQAHCVVRALGAHGTVGGTRQDAGYCLST